MSAAVARLSPPVCPDLTQALDDLDRIVSVRLPQVEEQLALEQVQKSPRQYEHLISVRTGLVDAIASKASIIGVKGGTMRLMAELAAEHRKRTNRRISLEQLLRDLRRALGVMKSHARQTEADRLVAAFRATAAANAQGYAEQGVAYIEASR